MHKSPRRKKIVVAPDSVTTLMKTLFAELFQTERSAIEHPEVEARRLGDDVGPALAMRAVSEHAARVAEEIPALARRWKVPEAKAGHAIGVGLSKMRSFFFDLAVSREKTYRGTLIGIRHGVDLVRLMNETGGSYDPELRTWCERWLAEREPLVERVTDELTWFAIHPELAQQRATSKLH